nr:MAG TPA: hypothetical protein [Caudoviricetes sp.]
MRLIDADKLNARLNRNGTPYYTVPDIENAPTVDIKAMIDDVLVCPSEGHHDYQMVAIGHDEVGDRVDIYRCSKCGEEFDVKFVA